MTHMPYTMLVDYIYGCIGDSSFACHAGGEHHCVTDSGEMIARWLYESHMTIYGYNT